MHALKVIAEAQSRNDSIDPLLLPSNRDDQDGQDMDDSDDFLELLGNLDEHTAAAINATKSSTESKYIQETVEAVENVGRFSDTNGEYCLHGTKKPEVNDENFISAMDQSFSIEPIPHEHQQLAPFVPATCALIRLNTKWIEQLKTEKERVRHGLITGNYDKDDGMLDFDAARDAVVTVIDPKHSDQHNHENHRTIPPVVLLTTNFPSQKTIAGEFTLNREQKAAFTIITSHLDGDIGCRTGTIRWRLLVSQCTACLGDNDGQLIMCILGCGGTGKYQLIRALSKYFLIKERMQMMRKLAPTGIAAAEIDGMTIHSFLGEQRHSAKPRTIKPGDSKLEREWRRVEYLLIDEMSMVGVSDDPGSGLDHLSPSMPLSLSL